MAGAPNTALRVVVVLALAIGAIAGIVVLAGGDDNPHRLSFTVPEAVSVNAGEYVREGGTPVGEVVSVDPVAKGTAARIVVKLADAAWPVNAGSKLELRWGGTVNRTNRYFRLTRAKTGAPLPENGVVPSDDVSIPLEFDGLLRTFNARARGDLRDFLDQAGAVSETSSGSFARTLDAAPPALHEAAYVLKDADDQIAAVSTLVRSGDRVLDAVQRSEPDVRALLDGAGGTFAAIADRATSLQQMLDGAPQTFTTTRDTLARADGTLVAARSLATRLAPGVTELARAAQPLDSVLETARDIGPDAEATLGSLRGVPPDLNPLLAKVRTLSPELRSIGKQSVDNLNCIRPFTPDILSYFSNWGDFFSAPDTKDKIIRAQVQGYGPAFSNVSSYTSAQAAQLYPGFKYGFPRPPGTNAGQPWFLPQCGAGKDALDPAKDPESRWSGTQPPALRALVPIPKGTK